jgi:hypothetical protein
MPSRPAGPHPPMHCSALHCTALRLHCGHKSPPPRRGPWLSGPRSAKKYCPPKEYCQWSTGLQYALINQVIKLFHSVWPGAPSQARPTALHCTALHFALHWAVYMARHPDHSALSLLHCTSNSAVHCTALHCQLHCTALPALVLPILHCTALQYGPLRNQPRTKHYEAIIQARSRIHCNNARPATTPHGHLTIWPSGHLVTWHQPPGTHRATGRWPLGRLG